MVGASVLSIIIKEEDEEEDEEEFRFVVVVVFVVAVAELHLVDVVVVKFNMSRVVVDIVAGCIYFGWLFSNCGADSRMHMSLAVLVALIGALFVELLFLLQTPSEWLWLFVAVFDFLSRFVCRFCN